MRGTRIVGYGLDALDVPAIVAYAIEKGGSMTGNEG